MREINTQECVCIYLEVRSRVTFVIELSFCSAFCGITLSLATGFN